MTTLMDPVPMPAGPAPDWLLLAPAGQSTGRDGRRFVLADAAGVVARFAADGADVPVDYEHSTHLRAPHGLDAPAAGWIVEMQARGGALWARVLWTAAGLEAILSRAYRYYSPAFMLARDVVVSVPSVGLTNKPNLPLPSLNSRRPDGLSPQATALLRRAFGHSSDVLARYLPAPEPGGVDVATAARIGRAFR